MKSDNKRQLFVSPTRVDTNKFGAHKQYNITYTTYHTSKMSQ